MFDIRYVCLSDMHLGDDGSVLTAIEPGATAVDVTRPSACLISLVECLRDVISKNSEGASKPALILNGDTLEMALSTTDIAATVFKRFIELIFGQDPLFDRIIYIPGNHDHHIWETARETQYVEYIKQITKNCVDTLEPQWHSTNMFDKNIMPRVESYLLKNVIADCIKDSPGIPKDFKIEIAYPNFAIKNDSKLVVFHHGHFIEWIYKFISYLKEIVFKDQKFPEEIWTLEGENFAWLDFVWSSLGQSGQAGNDVKKVYKSFGDKKSLEKLFEPMMDVLAEKINKPFLSKIPLLSKIPFISKVSNKLTSDILNGLKNVIIEIIPKKERSFNADVLSDTARTGLIKYLAVQVYAQINAENEEMPQDIKFIFGHTHTPFKEYMDVEADKYKHNCPNDYPKNYPTKFDLYNTGGWVVDTFKEDAYHGGAIVLVDDELNAASIKMYGETNYQVIAESASANPLIDRLKDIVNTANKPWADFSEIARSEVEIRRKVLRESA